MAEVYREAGRVEPIAPLLIERLEAVIERDEQAIILLNRRGWAPQAVCSACGTAVMCPHCDVTLTFHRGSGALKCHYCGHQQPFDPTCSNCGNPDMTTRGMGTEQLAAQLSRRVPGARVLRLDADAVSSRQAYAQSLASFAAGEANCLVGTQMVAKGLDFPRVTLVGLLGADQALSVPDFRAAERCFHLVAQVAGRAGRGERPGEVVVQAFDTAAPAITCALEHRTRDFYQQEMALRERYNYPPVSGLARIIWRGEQLPQVQAAAETTAAGMRQALLPDVTLLGPSEAGMVLLQGRYRWHMLIKGPTRQMVQRQFDRWLAAGLLKTPRNVHMAIDIDPQSIQ